MTTGYEELENLTATAIAALELHHRNMSDEHSCGDAGHAEHSEHQNGVAKGPVRVWVKHGNAPLAEVGFEKQPRLPSAANDRADLERAKVN
jgi:hypothetical protein